MAHQHPQFGHRSQHPSSLPPTQPSQHQGGGSIYGDDDDDTIRLNPFHPPSDGGQRPAQQPTTAVQQAPATAQQIDPVVERLRRILELYETPGNALVGANTHRDNLITVLDQAIGSVPRPKRPLPPRPAAPPSSMESSTSRAPPPLVPPSPLSGGYLTALSSPPPEPSHVHPPPYGLEPPTLPRTSNWSSPISSSTNRSSPGSPYNAGTSYQPAQPSPLGRRTHVDTYIQPITDITEALDPEEIVPHRRAGAWQQRIALPDSESASQPADSPTASPFLGGASHQPIRVRHPQVPASRHTDPIPSSNDSRPLESIPTSYSPTPDRRHALESGSASPSLSTGSPFSPATSQQFSVKFEPNRRTPSSDRGSAANDVTLARDMSSSTPAHVEVEDRPDCETGDLIYRIRELKSEIMFLEKKYKETRESYKTLGNIIDKVYVGHGLDTVTPRRPSTKPCRYKVIDQKDVVLPLLCDLVPTNFRVEDGPKFYQRAWIAGGRDQHDFIKLLISSGILLCQVPYSRLSDDPEMFRGKELPLFGRPGGGGATRG